MSVKDLKKYYAFNNFFKLSYKWDEPIDSFVVEKQISYYLKNRSHLKKGGVSLLRRLVNISSRMKRKSSNFNSLKNHLLKDFLPNNHVLSRSDLQKIYNIFNKKEKQKMLNILDKMVGESWYSSFLFELRFFYRKNRIPTREIGKRVTFLNNFYGFTRN